MRLATVLAPCLGLALLTTTGCDPLKPNNYLRYGIGTELNWEGMAEATRLQNRYLGHICEQAGLGVLREGDTIGCSATSMGDWGLLVQAGMNDIDLRCDAYLAWLDDKRRSANPILQQISDMRSATGTILDVAGVGVHPITVVGTAFGLAANTFTNVNSRLLLEVNQSTVQSVVLSRRNNYRLEIASVAIENRPAAIHALRSYLNICMPFTIEMEINTTVTAFERGGSAALNTPTLITADTISPTSALRTPSAPLGPREAIAQTKRPTSPPVPAHAAILDRYDPAVHTPSYVERIQDALCAPQNEMRAPGPVTKGLIGIFEAAYRPIGRPPRRDGKLDSDEIGEILLQGSCKNSLGRNYFERRTLTNDAIGQAALSDLIAGLKKYSAGAALQPNSALNEVRTAIAAVRNDAKLRGKLRPLPRELSDQITDDLFSELMKP